MTTKEVRVILRELALVREDSAQDVLKDQYKALLKGIQALKVVETLSILIEQGKVSSVTTDQLKQVLDEYMKGGDEE